MVASFSASAGWGWWALTRHADRRDSRSVRQPGHRLHRLDGPQPAGGRGPGHLPAHGQPPGAGRRPGGALAVGVRLLDDLRHLRGRRRSLLRPRARARALNLVTKTSAAGRRRRPRAGRDRRRPRLLVHRREPDALAARAAHPAGLVRPLPAERRPRRRRSRVGRRLRAAVPDRRRSESAARPTTSRLSAVVSAVRRQQPERRRQRPRVERRMADRPRRRLIQSIDDLKTDRRQRVGRRADLRWTRSPTCRSATRSAWRRS